MNLIILGDGYQWDQQSLFFEDLDRNLAVMWATEPYKSYRNYMNVYAVEVASVDYGVRCDPDGRVRHPDGTIRDTGEREGPINTKNTMLRLTFSNGCNDPLARGTVYTGPPVNCADFAAYYPEGLDPCASGTGADSMHNQIIDRYVVPVMGVPRTAQNVQSLAIFNTFTYGGIGGANATASGGSPQGPLISLHELGHSHGSMADEYPYSSRDVVRACYTGGEPGSFHHTIRTSTEQMIAEQHKWWRWIGEESLSGGIIGLHEGGGQFPCGQRRPSEHSIMRWIGFDWDQVGREHMVARITGLRNSGQMPLRHTPLGTVPRDSVLWVETLHPKSHELDVTWRVGGPSGDVLDTNNSRNLDLGELDLAPGTVVHVEARDPVGPDGIDWVRNPSTDNSVTNSGYNGPRFVQTRQWTVGDATVEPSPPAAEITLASMTNQPVAGDDVVYVETNHPTDRVLDVAWFLAGEQLPNPHNSRNLALGELDLEPGTYALRAEVTDPADPGGVSDSIEWTVDNALPTAPRTLSEPLTTLDGDLEHAVYFDGWDMFLAPQDDQTGYDEQRHVVGQLRLNEDGWFNYFGFPEEEDTPFKFRHSGTNVKALTYGNFGTGGLSKATFEQYFEGHPSGTFVPGFGTHFVEHRATDPAGNIGETESYRATVVPGDAAECTETITGNRSGRVVVSAGVTCLSGARVIGGVTVAGGASLVATDSTINGALQSAGAEVVQIFGSTVNGATTITGTTTGVWAAGSTFRGDVTLTDNQQVVRDQGTDRWDERFKLYGFDYGPILVGNTVNGSLACTGNSAPARDFGAANVISDAAGGECAEL
jgi:IgA Peptidase M64